MKRITKSRILGGGKRTRQVFGINPWLKLGGYVLITLVVILGLYVLLTFENTEKPVEEEVIKETTKAVKTISEEKDVKPIEKKIVYDYDHPYGDTSLDSGFPDVCKKYINNIKSDIDALYEHKVKAQEEFDEIAEEYRKSEEKLEKANNKIDSKRESLEEARESCVDDGSPN